MAKRGFALGIALVTALSIGGCANNSEPTPFDRSIQRVDPRYEEDAVVDGKFIDEVERIRGENRNFTDEEYIRYGKALCTLLDDSDDPKKIVEDFKGEEQAIGDAAIHIYCPHHL